MLEIDKEHVQTPAARVIAMDQLGAPLADRAGQQIDDQSDPPAKSRAGLAPLLAEEMNQVAGVLGSEGTREERDQRPGQSSRIHVVRGLRRPARRARLTASASRAASSPRTRRPVVVRR